MPVFFVVVIAWMLAAAATESTGHLDFADLWDRVSVEALSRGCWKAVDSPPESGLSMWLRQESPSFFHLRTEYELPASLDFVISSVRPEVIFHPQRPMFSSLLSECCVEKVLSPGDAQGMVRFSSDSCGEIQRQAFLYGNSEECARVVRKNGSYSLFEIRRMRFAVHRDFPAPGQCVVASAPCDQETREIREEYGVQRASTGLLEAAGPERTKVTEIKRIPAGSAWALSQSFVGSTPMVEAVYRQMYLRGMSFMASPVGRELIDNHGGYTVLTLRKCSHGPPMLPQVLGCDSHSGGDRAGCNLSWVQAEKYELPGYLDTFLRELGVVVDIFEQLEGRQLIHYQAAVRLEDWERVRAALEVPWRVMKAAYRRQLGGSWAPELTPGKPPRFVAWKRYQDDGQAYEPQATEPRQFVPEANTFVHFTGDQVAPGLMKRSGSTSQLETQHLDDVD